jgi:hypothetical protein
MNDGLPVGDIFTVDKPVLLVTTDIAAVPLDLAKLTNVVVKLPLVIDVLKAFVTDENALSVLLKPQLAAFGIETLYNIIKPAHEDEDEDEIEDDNDSVDESASTPSDTEEASRLVRN